MSASIIFKNGFQVKNSVYISGRRNNTIKKFSEYVDYVDRKASHNQNYDFSSYVGEYMDNNEKRNIYEREKNETELFNDSYNFLTKEEKELQKKKFEKAYEKGQIMWIPIISFEEEFLVENNIYNPGSNIYDSQKLKDACRKSVGRLIEKEGIEDALWNACIHYNTDNLHIHIALIEDPDTKKEKRKRGKFKSKNINVAKSTFAHEIISKSKDSILISDIIRDDFINQLRNNPKDIKKDKEIKKCFEKFAKKLKESNIPKNKWQYGQNLMHPYKEAADDIVDMLIDKYYKDDYENLTELLDKEAERYEKIYGKGAGEKYKKNKLDRLKKNMANQVFKIAKDYVRETQDKERKRKNAIYNLKHEFIRNSIALELSLRKLKKAFYISRDNIKNQIRYQMLEEVREREYQSEITLYYTDKKI